MQEGFVYLVNNEGGFYAVNAQRVHRTRMTSTASTPETEDVAVMGKTVCVVDEDGLLVFDMSDPQHPRRGRFQF